MRMRSMTIVTTTRHGAVRLKMSYSVLSNGMPCVRCSAIPSSVHFGGVTITSSAW